MTTIAEGVEEVEQLRALRELGCELAQGFHFSHPIVAEDVEERLRGGMPRLPAALDEAEPAATADAAA